MNVNVEKKDQVTDFDIFNPFTLDIGETVEEMLERAESGVGAVTNFNMKDFAI